MIRLIRITLLAPVAFLLSCTGTPVASPAGNSSTPAASPTPSANGTTSPEPAASFHLSGHVFDDDATAVQGASITAQPASGASTTVATAGDGGYSLTLSPGKYTVTATKAGWTTRSQSVSVSADGSLDFGSVSADPANPYFIAKWVEIKGVDVNEGAPGGPLTLVLHLSAPLTVSSQANFLSRLEIQAGSADFLRPAVPNGTLVTQNSWDTIGQNLTVQFAGPYLPSGTTPIYYTAKLRQNSLGTNDPVSNEPQWEDMGISNAQGDPIGQGRANAAFLKTPLAPIPLTYIANKTWGYYPNEARWNLTHTGSFSFQAAKDATPPALISVKVETNQNFAGQSADVMTLHFSKPMWAAKDVDNPQFTRLDTSKSLISAIQTSTDSSGAGAGPSATVRPSGFRFLTNDPTAVELLYGAGTFNNERWIKVTIGPDMLDPAGNAPDPSRTTVTGTVG